MNPSSVLVKLIALGAIIAALGALHYKSQGEAVDRAEKAVEARLNASYSKALLKANEEALKIQNTLAKEAKEREDDKAKHIDAINDKLRIAVSELRNRPIRPNSYSPSPRVIYSCEGSQLFREDAEFLTREAARADQVIVERDYYYEQYEAVRKKLNGN